MTNLRDFLLVGQDAEGNQVKLEAYRLAPNEADFWREAAHPRRLAAAHGERCIEYLKRVMLQAAPLAAPKDLAWFLASYARDAKARIEGVALPALDTLRAALEEALGMKFEGTRPTPTRASTSSAPPWCRRYSTGCSPPGSCGTKRIPAPTGRPASTGGRPSGISVFP